MHVPESLLDSSDSDNRLKEAVQQTENPIKTDENQVSPQPSEGKRKLAPTVATMNADDTTGTATKRPRLLIPPTDYLKLRSPLTSIRRTAMSRANINMNSNLGGSIQKKLILDESSFGKNISKLPQPTSTTTTMAGELCHSKLRTPSDYNSSTKKVGESLFANLCVCYLCKLKWNCLFLLCRPRCNQK